MVIVELYAYMCTYSTKKIIGMCTISREDHRVAQTRELECTKTVVPQVVARGEFHVSCTTNANNTFR
jgi:hypothetical protein